MPNEGTRMITKEMKEQLTWKIHQLVIDEHEGEYINYVRDRFNDEELLTAYKIGVEKGLRLASKRKQR